MARYTKDIELQLPAEEVEEEVQKFIAQAGLYPTNWNGEDCFCADYTPFGMPAGQEFYKRIYFFKSSYENGVLHMEAWIRDGRMKEDTLTGMSAMTMKQPYLNEILRFENRLFAMLPEDSELRKKNMEAGQAVRKADKRQKGGMKALRGISVLVLLWAAFECLRHLGIL